MEFKLKRNFLKKTVALLMLAILPATYVFAINVGDVTGKILSTDITAFINGFPVTSYNIAGRTAIITQELASLGFGVSFDEASRILTLSKNGQGTSTLPPLNIESSKNLPIGTVVGNVYHTDIVTEFEGNVLNSFNIGGLTCVYADDFAALCGSYVWDETARTVHVTIEGARKNVLSKKEAERVLGGDLSKCAEYVSNRWGEPKKSHLLQCENGDFLAVENGEHINIERYDREFNRINSYAIKKELPIFGALYCGKDYNYIAFGQENLQEDNAREIIKIVIYDKSFVKISEVSVNNCKTSVPFDASLGEMYENERYLVLHTSRSQYGDENGICPQTQLTVIVDKNEWKVCNMLGKYQQNHTSHALRELVRIDDDRIVTIDLSDTAPYRGVILRTMDFNGNVYGTQSIFNAGGALGANCTGIMTGGLEVSESGYITVINTIDQSSAVSFTNVDIDGKTFENRDVYVLWNKKDTWEQKHTRLTYNSGNLTAGVPYLIPLSNGNFIVMWQNIENGSDAQSVSYAYIDGNGNVIGTVRTYQGAELSPSCTPIETEQGVVWYVNTDSGRVFYTIDVKEENKEEKSPALETPQNPEKENVTKVDGI